MAILQSPVGLILFGVFVGVFSGLMGLGGGAVIIPILVLLFEFSQQKAHGTSLAMILSPTQIPAIWRYHASGNVDWRLVFYVVPGMLAGSYVGARIANSIPQGALRLVFGFILIYVAVYTVFSSFGPSHLLRTTLVAMVVVLLTVGLFLGTGWYDRRNGQPVSPAPVSPPPATSAGAVPADAPEKGPSPER